MKHQVHKPHISAQLKARYFKELWETPQENLKIDSIKFGVFSDGDIDQLSSTQITSSSIYNPDTLKPNESGPLDPRLGVSGHTSKTECASCHLSGRECMGHFGHIDLVLPCFHIGFIKDVIQILRIICKSCSRVLLSPSSNSDNETPSYWRQRMSARILSRTQYQKLLKQVIEICKKKRKCSYCGELNGSIKKHTKSFRILHEKYQKIQENISHYAEKRMMENEETAYYLELYDNVVDYEQLHNAKKFGEFARSVNGNTFEDLMPWDVRALFENIIPSDYVLIGLRFARHRPENLILTKLPVPPSIIRPGARLEDDKANDDDLTAQLAKIVECNNLITIAMEKGGNVATIIENFFFLNKKISEYFISDLPGYPTAPMKSIGNSGRRGALAGTQISHKGKKIRSFSDRLKGKFGRFRGNLSGKRVNFSGRTVISPDPNLELDELGVPIDICKLLTFCEMVTKHNIKHMRKLILNGPHRYPGAVQYGQRIQGKKNGCSVEFKYISLKKAKFRANIVDNLLKYGDTVERHLHNRDIILFNRQPSLHRVSIMSHRVKVVPHRTFRFNPCCCNPYNADFDGDEMNIHAPQTLMARAEAQILMNVAQNFSAPKAAEPLVVPLQDIITSTYLLTLKRMFLSYEQVVQLVGYMDNGCIASKYVIPQAAIIKPIRLWTGKQIFSMLMKPNDEKNEDWPSVNLETEARNFGKAPVLSKKDKISNETVNEYAVHKCMDYKDGFVVIRNSELMCGNIDKNILGSSTKGLFFRMLRDYGAKHTARCMTRLTKVATRFLYSYGFSIGIRDVTATKELVDIQNALVQSGYNDCTAFLESYQNGTLQCAPGCDTLQTLESNMNRRLSQIREDAGKQCINKLPYYYNAPLMMAECGSKGSKINISQMVMMVGQQTVGGSRVRDQFIHRTLPHFDINSKTPKAKGFVQNSFFTGITATEFFFHTMGGREGLVDTAVKTAETGYMQRRLMKNIEDICVEYDYTVRNCKKQIVQFFFGNDGIDPMCAEDTKSPVNFSAILRNIRAQRGGIAKQNLVVLSPQDMLSTSREIIFEIVGKRVHFVRRNVMYLDKKCELQFEYEMFAFVEQEIVTPARDYYEEHGDDHWYKELYGYTADEILQLISKATDCYITCIMEPGSAVGGVSATSLGEPATQMTLKTFHFAGVASMNITQGVPRIKEIINATANMKTPVMTMQLEINNDPDIARIVKSRIDITRLGSICKYMQQVIRSQKAYVECVLDLKKIGQLHLELTNRDIAIIISMNLKKILPKIKGHRILVSDIRVATKNDNLIRVQPRSQKVSKQIFGIILNHLLVSLQNVKIKGTPKVNRALIHKKQDRLSKNTLATLKKGSILIFDPDGKGKKKEVYVTDIDAEHGMIDIKVVGKDDESFQNIPYSMFDQSTYQLYVEGKECFLDILNVSGINSKESVSNDIIEVAKVLGIEAATKTIVNELTSVYHSHGLKVDQRHLMLVGDLMTYTGRVLGFSRHGMMGKEDKSILTMASYEETVKHLFQAALHGEKTKIRGVSDSIIVGTPIPIGTGACSVLRDVDRRSIYKGKDEKGYLPKREALLLGQSPFKAMTNNDIIVTNNRDKPGVLMRSQPLFSIDSRSLTLFRICVCLWTLRDLYCRIPYLEAWHTDTGVLEPHMTPHQSFIHQILFYRGSYKLQVCLFIIHFIITCNLLIGYKTPFASVLHFVFTISLQERMYYVLDGGDRLFRHLSFWLIFLPSWHGDATSIDAIHISNQRKKSLAMYIGKHCKKNNKGSGSKTSSVAYYSIIRSFATAAVLIQSMIIYPFIMFYRWTGEQQTWYWSKCTAVHNSMAMYMMSKDLGLYLATFPMITLILCRLTIVLEIVLPVMILLVPWDVIKYLILCILFGMQLGFNLCIRLENFGYTATTAMILFIPSIVWDALGACIQNISILNTCKLKLRTSMVRAARTFKMFELVANPTTNAAKSDAPEIIETKHSFLWNIPLISEDEKRNIENIHSSKDIGVIEPVPTAWNRYLSLFFLIYVFVNNFGDVQLSLFSKPDGGNIGELLRIDQQWVMYGPDVIPHTNIDLLVGEIEIKHGNEKNVKKIVLNELLTSNWKKTTVFEGTKKYKRPLNPTKLNPNMRWERFFEKVGTRSDMINSVLFWFCKHVKEREIRLKYQNHNNRYDDGVAIKQEIVEVNKMVRAGWCLLEGEIIDSWKQNATIPWPQYQDETIRCYHQIACPLL